MVNIPTMRNEQIGFRSPSTSTQQNETQERLFDDIIRLFDLTNQLEKELDASEEAFEVTHRFQSAHVRKLENRLVHLEELLRKKQAGVSQKTAYIFPESLFPDPHASVNEQLYLDPLYNVAHLPIAGKSISKVYFRNTGDSAIQLPSDLQVSILPEPKKIWSVKENNVLNAFNGSNNSHWKRKITVPIEETVSSITNSIEVTLPDKMVSNRNVNTIYLNPFPVHSMSIDKVEYRLEGNWKLIPGWGIDKDTNEPVPRKYAGNIKLCFPDTAMRQIRVTMTQTDWFEENQRKAFHFGFQEIGIFYNDYQSDTGRMDIPITLQSDTSTRLITGIKPLFENEQALSDLSEEKSSVFTYSIYTIDASGQLTYTKDAFPILVTEDQLFIKASIHIDPHNGATPSLRAIELTYEDI